MSTYGSIENQSSQLEKLRAPFEPNQISKLPKPFSKDSQKGQCKECGGYHGLPAVHLDYVGHAALTDRLLSVDPLWSWEPLALDANGLPLLDKDGGMWIKLTVCGVTRLGYGDAQGKTGANATKERIGDGLRNAAMRFGAALDLWHKGILHLDMDDDDTPPARQDKPAAKHPISGKAFDKALMSIRAKQYTLAEIEQTYTLTEDQRVAALDAEKESA
jgi:hypothetical protein